VDQKRRVREHNASHSERFTFLILNPPAALVLLPKHGAFSYFSRPTLGSKDLRFPTWFKLLVFKQLSTMGNVAGANAQENLTEAEVNQ
jgi:hypothetical protein